MLLSFIIQPVQDQVSYSEYIKTTLKTKLMLDIRDCKEIRIHLSSNRQRYLWVGLGSAVAEDYGWAVYVDYPKMYRFRMDEISYPTWDENGDPGMLERLLKECTGVSFAPAAALTVRGIKWP